MRAILLAILLFCAGVASAQEKVGFPSRDPDATPVDGYILRPEGAGPFPAVVLHHGCGGMWARNDRISARELWWMRHLVSLGYAAMEVDSFRPRGLDSVCGDREKSPAVLQHRPADSYGALAWLRKQPYIDGARVAVMGFSHGGSTVLGTAWHAQPARPDGDGYRAAIDFYPGCTA
jgi:dienelactone hydrolase